ncbi:MAG: helix-turn-helix domain-containing protein [Oscillospiraceae bacterium]|nr:helix-turn-helix domain-containing protein [Oscillospiraceae bacterium]
MGKEFPERLRQLRKRQNISQSTLSQLCGLGKNAIARYERGERIPTLPALLAIADYFMISLDELTGRGKIPGACDFGARSRPGRGPPAPELCALRSWGPFPQLAEASGRRVWGRLLTP